MVWPDAKRPGKYVAKLWAKSFRGSSPQQTIYVALMGVSGILFQNGIESATFKAPQVQGDNTHQTIIATGGVIFTSLRNKGTWIKAERVTWSAKTNKGVATGNVIMRYGQSGMTVHTPRLYFDTALRTVQSSAGYGTLP
jgi:lipopolysaccharide assembly outer membrane protein LptD (OstA)